MVFIADMLNSSHHVIAFQEKFLAFQEKILQTVSNTVLFTRKSWAREQRRRDVTKSTRTILVSTRKDSRRVTLRVNRENLFASRMVRRWRHLYYCFVCSSCSLFASNELCTSAHTKCSCSIMIFMICPMLSLSSTRNEVERSVYDLLLVLNVIRLINCFVVSLLNKRNLHYYLQRKPRLLNVF